MSEKASLGNSKFWLYTESFNVVALNAPELYTIPQQIQSARPEFMMLQFGSIINEVVCIGLGKMSGLVATLAAVGPNIIRLTSGGATYYVLKLPYLPGLNGITFRKSGGNLLFVTIFFYNGDIVSINS